MTDPPKKADPCPICHLWGGDTQAQLKEHVSFFHPDGKWVKASVPGKEPEDPADPIPAETVPLQDPRE